MISSNQLANRIGTEQKSNGSVEKHTEIRRPFDFLSQWIFFAAIALIPNIISFAIKFKKGDTLWTFFEDHRVLYVSSTLALVLLIDQIQRLKFQNRHFIYLLVIFMGFAIYILMDNGVKFGLFSEIIDFASFNIVYLAFVLYFGFFEVLYFISKFRRK